jgi:LysR family transcriptional regulator, transcriptional activator for bauABCD operon
MRRLSSIDLRLLKIFTVVVDCNGFQRAQIALNMAQSTLSTHIASLEAKLGSKLCDRGRGGFRLTEAGRETYEAILALLRAMEGFEARMDRVHAGRAAALRIATIDTVASAKEIGLDSALRQFSDRHPDVAIDLEILAAGELERSLIEGRRDVVIGPMSLGHSAVEYREIFTEMHHLYCGWLHPLFGCEDNQITPQDLGTARVCVRAYRYFDDMHRFGKASVGAKASNMEAQLMLILSGRFIGFLPDHAAAPLVKSGEIRPLKTAEWTMTSRFFAGHLRDAENQALKQRFVRLLG